MSAIENWKSSDIWVNTDNLIQAASLLGTLGPSLTPILPMKAPSASSRGTPPGKVIRPPLLCSRLNTLQFLHLLTLSAWFWIIVVPSVKMHFNYSWIFFATSEFLQMEWMFWIPADQVGSSCLIPPTPSWKLFLFVKVQSPTWTERQCELFLLQHHCNQPEICSPSNWIKCCWWSWWFL